MRFVTVHRLGFVTFVAPFLFRMVWMVYSLGVFVTKFCALSSHRYTSPHSTARFTVRLRSFLYLRGSLVSLRCTCAHTRLTHISWLDRGLPGGLFTRFTGSFTPSLPFWFGFYARFALLVLGSRVFSLRWFVTRSRLGAHSLFVCTRHSLGSRVCVSLFFVLPGCTCTAFTAFAFVTFRAPFV